MPTKTLYEFEKCEAAKADGTRCQHEAHEAVFNPGAYLPFQVCGTHYNTAQRLLEREGALPRNWGRYSF